MSKNKNPKFHDVVEVFIFRASIITILFIVRKKSSANIRAGQELFMVAKRLAHAKIYIYILAKIADFAAFFTRPGFYQN